MAGKVRHLVNRSGRYHARLVVPKELRTIVGKTELRAPLGGDYRQALKLLPGAVAQLQHQIALAEQKAGAGRTQPGPARYPLAPEQIAMSHYMQRLAYDDELRNDPRWPSVGIDDVLVQRLRDALAGRASDAELADLVGLEIKRFRAAEPVSLNRLWAAYVQMRQQTGSMRDGGKQLGVAVEKLRKFVQHDDAARLAGLTVCQDRLCARCPGTGPA